MNLDTILGEFETKYQKCLFLPEAKKSQASLLLLHQCNTFLEKEYLNDHIENMMCLLVELASVLRFWIFSSAGVSYVNMQNDHNNRWIKSAIKLLEIMQTMVQQIDMDQCKESAFYNNMIILCQILAHMYRKHPISASMGKSMCMFLCEMHFWTMTQLTHASISDTKLIKHCERLLSITNFVLQEPLVINTSLTKFNDQCSEEERVLFRKERKQENQKKTDKSLKKVQRKKRTAKTKSPTTSTIPVAAAKTTAVVKIAAEEEKIVPAAEAEKKVPAKTATEKTPKKTKIVDNNKKSQNFIDLVTIPDTKLVKTINNRSSEFYKIVVHAHVKSFDNQFLQAFFDNHPLVSVAQLQSQKNKLFAGKDHNVHMKNAIWLFIERDNVDYTKINKDMFVFINDPDQKEIVFPSQSIIKVRVVQKNQVQQYAASSAATSSSSSSASSSESSSSSSSSATSLKSSSSSFSDDVGDRDSDDDDEHNATDKRKKKAKNTLHLLSSTPKQEYYVEISFVTAELNQLTKEWLLQFLPPIQHNNRVVCFECNQTFANKEKKADHIRQNHEKSNIRFWCTFPGCKQNFSQCNALLNHITSNHVEDKPQLVCPYEQCAFRKKKFKTSKNLETHIRNNHSKPRKCPSCDFNFAQLTDFRNHVDEKHSGKLLTEEIKSFLERMEKRQNTLSSLSNRGKAGSGLQILQPYFTHIPKDLSFIAPFVVEDKENSVLDIDE